MLASIREEPACAQPKCKLLPIGAPYDGNKDSFYAWKSLIAHKLEAD